MLRYGECGKEDYVVFGSQMRLRRVLRVPFVLLRHTSNDSFRRVFRVELESVSKSISSLQRFSFVGNHVVSCLH
jgi:hypothetical protein